MKRKEKSKRSEATLAVRMKHEDDSGMNEDSKLEPRRVHASNKEDSQKTTTLTDNKKRLRKRRIFNA